jgi:hypothetical protein
VRTKVSLRLFACNKSVPMISLTAYVLPNITEYTASQTQPIEMWSHLRDLELADPNPASQHPIYLLLGTNTFSSIFLPVSPCLDPTDAPMALKTVFGWIIADPLSGTPNDTDRTHVSHCTVRY